MALQYAQQESQVHVQSSNGDANEYYPEEPSTLLGDQLIPRQGADSLKGYLLTVGETIKLPQLRTQLRTHLIPADVNGLFQQSKLAEFLANLVTDYCIPRERRIEAVKEQIATGSQEPVNSLRKEAIELFVDNNSSGEAGELLLYLLTERVLGAPQIMSKMSLKTSPMMHYHGADGVHAKLTDTGLAVYWGESKIYSDRATAVAECLNSVAPFLTDPNRKTASRDLGLVRDNLDVEQKALKDKMVRFFIKKNPEWNKLELRATCLVGFDLDEYPNYVDGDDIREDDQIHDFINDWSEHVGKHISKNNLETFEIDFFLLPFTNVDGFRTQTLTALGAPTND